MSKKTISKVVAVICVIAMCFTAVFTGAVSADNRSATCEVKGYSYNLGAGDVYVGYEATFESSTAFTAGSFTISVPDTLKFIDCTAKVSSVDGYVPNVYLNVQNNKVLFAGFSETAADDIQAFTSLTLVLKFSPTTAIKGCAAGTTWNITLSSISITNTAEETYTCSNATGTAHVHNFTGATTANGVTTKTCNVGGCGAKDHQIETTNTLGTNTLAATRKATLNFASDGDTVLVALVAKTVVDNLGGTTYFVYKYKDDDAEYKTVTVAADGTVEVDNVEYYRFPCGRNGGIGRMSRNITGNFINVGATTTISGDWSYSIASYAKDVADSSTQNVKDRNYCKALWNYGYYTAERLAVTQPSFVADRDSYGSTYSEVFNTNGVADSKTADKNGLSPASISVTTGYKPKMNVKFNESKTITVKAYKDYTKADLVYMKTFNGTTFTISDIPAKYLAGAIELSEGNNTFTYGFGKYAKARIDGSKDDANVFKSMMNYAYYLNAKFAA